jgi:hypothetical protein
VSNRLCEHTAELLIGRLNRRGLRVAPRLGTASARAAWVYSNTIRLGRKAGMEDSAKI